MRNLGAAGCGIEAFVREIGGEYERLVSCFSDGIAEAMIVAIESSEHSPGLQVRFHVITCHHVRLRTGKDIPVDIDLEMVRVRAVEAIHEKWPPGRPAFEERHS